MYFLSTVDWTYMYIINRFITVLSTSYLIIHKFSWTSVNNQCQNLHEAQQHRHKFVICYECNFYPRNVSTNNIQTFTCQLGIRCFIACLQNTKHIYKHVSSFRSFYSFPHFINVIQKDSSLWVVINYLQLSNTTNQPFLAHSLPSCNLSEQCSVLFPSA